MVSNTPARAWGGGGGVGILLRDICPASGPFSGILTDPNLPGVNMHDPDGASPSHEQPLNRLGGFELLLLQLLSSQRFGPLLCFLGRLVGLDGLLVNPLNPPLPDAGHLLPLFRLRPILVTDALPGVFGVSTFEMQFRAHDLDSMLVEPCHVSTRQRPLDGVDGALARVKDRILS